MYMELEHELAKFGFTDGPRLEALFRSVDFDKSGTLDFKEFLSLVYLWHNVEDGDYSRLFNQEVFLLSGCRLTIRPAIEWRPRLCACAVLRPKPRPPNARPRAPQDAEVVSTAFACIDQAMVAYDSDHSRRLCAAELEVFFREQWPQATLRSGTGVFERA